MKKLGIKEVQDFIKQKLRDKVLERYKSFQILSEADLQSHVWQILYDYFKSDPRTKNMIMVLNKPYLKEIGIHPDIVIFRRKKPWIIIELKEWKKPRKKSALRDFKRILDAKDHFSNKYNYKLQRGYFLYVAWNKPEIDNLIDNSNKVYFHEIQAILEHKNKNEKRIWEDKFKQLSKYISKPKSRAHHLTSQQLP